MEIVFLGTTAALPTRERNHPAIALLYGGEVILWDCGEGTQRQLVRGKVNFMRISRVFITHLHGDHFLGLPGLIQSMAFSGREKPLEVYGPKGTIELMKAILGLGYYTLGFEVRVEELEEGGVVEGEGYRVEALGVQHSVPTLALVFEEVKGRRFLREKAEALGIPPGPMYKKLQHGESVEYRGKMISPSQVLGERKEGFKVVYSSDTRPLKKISERVEGSVLIHDSTFSAEMEDKALTNLHSTAREAARVAREGGAKALYLTHISPRFRGSSALEKEAREIFPNSYLARDLLRVNLRGL